MGTKLRINFERRSGQNPHSGKQSSPKQSSVRFGGWVIGGFLLGLIGSVIVLIIVIQLTPSCFFGPCEKESEQTIENLGTALMLVLPIVGAVIGGFIAAFRIGGPTNK